MVHGRRGKLIGHVMPYWLVKPPTSCAPQLSFSRGDLLPVASHDVPYSRFGSDAKQAYPTVQKFQYSMIL